jgi:hypothetical protein
MTPWEQDLLLAVRDHRRNELWRELRDISERLLQVVLDLQVHEPHVPASRWRDPRQLELPLRGRR